LITWFYRDPRGKTPPAQRDRARVTGLLLAMVMRLLLLRLSPGWLRSPTLFFLPRPQFQRARSDYAFGGLFLLFKATVELNERLEGKDSDNPTQRRGAKFWAVVAQIVVLDAVFSRLGDHRRRDG
jgi:predicted tellurium resistance membrane protein TerC